MQEYIQMLWPVTISTSIGYLYSYVDVFFTSQIEEGGWTALVNANRRTTASGRLTHSYACANPAPLYHVRHRGQDKRPQSRAAQGADTALVFSPAHVGDIACCARSNCALAL